MFCLGKCAILSLISHFPRDPFHDHICHIFLLHFCQFSPLGDMMPFFQTAAAAGTCGMLGNKYWMSTHWCLFAIIYYICRSFSLCNKILCMLSYCIKTFFIYVINIFLLQMETASKLGIIQSFQQLPIPFILRHIITTNRMVSWFLNFDIHVSHNILSAYPHL